MQVRMLESPMPIGTDYISRENKPRLTTAEMQVLGSRIDTGILMLEADRRLLANMHRELRSLQMGMRLGRDINLDAVRRLRADITKQQSEISLRKRKLREAGAKI